MLYFMLYTVSMTSACFPSFSLRILPIDWIVLAIDLPPTNEVADAQIVSRLVDGMVLVVRSGGTKQRELAEAEGVLTSAGSRICGVVINDISLKQGGKYGYKYGGQYGYKYGYRYGYEARRK